MLSGVVGYGQVRLGILMPYQYKRNNRELLKEQCLEYLGGKRCCVCGIDYYPIMNYDFHHCKGEKIEEISKMLTRKIVLDKELKAELDKCVVLCDTHHRQITLRLIHL